MFIWFEIKAKSKEKVEFRYTKSPLTGMKMFMEINQKL